MMAVQIPAQGMTTTIHDHSSLAPGFPKIIVRAQRIESLWSAWYTRDGHERITLSRKQKSSLDFLFLSFPKSHTQLSPTLPVCLNLPPFVPAFLDHRVDTGKGRLVTR